jgi:hypothetical protein
VDKHSARVNDPIISWKASQVLAEHNFFVFPLYSISLNLVKPSIKKELGEGTVTAVERGILGAGPCFLIKVRTRKRTF